MEIEGGYVEGEDEEYDEEGERAYGSIGLAGWGRRFVGTAGGACRVWLPRLLGCRRADWLARPCLCTHFFALISSPNGPNHCRG